MAGMEALLRRLIPGLTLRGSASVGDRLEHPDTAETVYIGALPLLKMLKHARSGVPLEVMGLLLGKFVDDSTIKVVDVFAMPQSGTSVTVESVDPAFQAKMLDMLRTTGRSEMVVGWYHSHPGFGCWLSSVDVNTQKSFEALHPRAVAIVVDPLQSVKGKVMLDAFRSIDPMLVLTRSLAPTGEPRQTTSNIGNMEMPSLIAKVHGLGTKYYSLTISYSTTELEQKMLMTLHRKTWSDGLSLGDYKKRVADNADTLTQMIKLTKQFSKDVVEDTENPKKTKVEKDRKKFGKLNARQRLQMTSTNLMEDNIQHSLAGILNSASFH